MAVELDSEGITVIELHMVDKKKYFPLALASGFVVRGVLYPVSLVKTRLQMQRASNPIYSSTFDAFRKISAAEGMRGLYKGFWVQNMLMVSQMTYITTYEGMRYFLEHNAEFSNNHIKSFVGGFCASLVGQTTMVPIDIVTQHLQMLGKKDSAPSGKTVKLFIPEEAKLSRLGAAKAITLALYKRDGVAGFYKGYLTSLSLYAPNSAMWWLMYQTYCDIVSSVAPVWVPRLVLQCIAAPLSGSTTGLMFTPLDAIRARMQVENTKFWETTTTLWKEERYRIFIKGLGPRMITSITFSFFIILGYETIKRASLHDEYKDSVRW